MTLHDHHPSMLASPYSNVSSIPHHPLTNHHDVHRRQVLCTIVCLYSAPSYLKNSLLIFHIKSTIIMIFSHQVAISSMCVRRTTRLFFDDDQDSYVHAKNKSRHNWGCIFDEGDTHTKTRLLSLNDVCFGCFDLIYLLLFSTIL